MMILIENLLYVSWKQAACKASNIKQEHAAMKFHKCGFTKMCWSHQNVSSKPSATDGLEETFWWLQHIEAD